jgi:hypothetical protein
VILRYVLNEVELNSVYCVPFIVLNNFENKLKFYKCYGLNGKIIMSAVNNAQNCAV